MIGADYAAYLAEAIYNPKNTRVFDEVRSFDAVTVGLSKCGSTLCVTFQGTQDGRQWLRDFEAVPYHHPQLGIIHAGFWKGMRDCFEWLAPKLALQRVAVSAHSLGCAHAEILTALCAVHSIPIEQLFLFAPPLCGEQHFVELVEGHARHILALRNGLDPVPKVPIPVPGFEVRQVNNLRRVWSAPTWYVAWDPIRWHAIKLYRSAAEKL